MPDCKNCIIVYPFNPVFSSEKLAAFGPFSNGDTGELYSNLYLNHHENIHNLLESVHTYYVVMEDDRQFVPDYLDSDRSTVYYVSRGERWDSLNGILTKRISIEACNAAVIFANSMGISAESLRQTFYLLNNEDNNLVIGKTATNKITLLGMNYFNESIFSGLEFRMPDLDTFLKSLSPEDYYIFTLNGFYSVENIEDFKTLYKVLSRKESIQFCGMERHERFTNLFIEYKDLLS